MKAAPLAVIVMSVIVASCADKPVEQAKKDPTSPTPATVTTQKATVSAASSTVCQSYQKELGAITAQLASAPSADLQDQKAAFEAMTADYCH
jgi:hypothetical protein